MHSQAVKAKSEVDIFEKEEANGALIRARTTWHIEGEKPSRYFCNLENYNALQKYIPRLKVKDENNREIMVTEQKKVEKKLKKIMENFMSLMKLMLMELLTLFLELKMQIIALNLEQVKQKHLKE